MPPMAVFTGTADLLNTDAHRLRNRAAEAKLPLTFFEYPDMFHVWMGAPIPEGRAALDEVAQFLRR